MGVVDDVDYSTCVKNESNCEKVAVLDTLRQDQCSPLPHHYQSNFPLHHILEKVWIFLIDGSFSYQSPHLQAKLAKPFGVKPLGKVGDPVFLKLRIVRRTLC